MDPRMRLKEVVADWRPPDELERSRPRDVLLKPAGRALAVLVVLLAAGSLISGVLLYVKSTAAHQTRRQILQSGEDTEGRVLRRTQARSGKEKKFWVVYEFRAGGRTYESELRVGRATWQQLDTGTPLPVRYVVSDPARHVVVGHEGGLMPLWVPYLVAGGFALGAWLLNMALLSQRLLLAEGRPAPAIVTRHEKVQHGAVVHFVFPLLSGATAEGKTGPDKKPPALGGILCVLYLPDRPQHNATYPLALVRTAHGPQTRRARHTNGARRVSEGPAPSRMRGLRRHLGLFSSSRSATGSPAQRVR